MKAFAEEKDLQEIFLKLKQFPNVVGIDGELQPRIKNHKPIKGTSVIRIYVSEKFPKESFEDKESFLCKAKSKLFGLHGHWGTEDMIPSQLNGIEVDVVEMGDVQALCASAKMKQRMDGSRPVKPRQVTQTRYRPLQAGTSSTHYQSTACTLNGLFKEIATGKLLMASNNHCFINGTKVLSNPSFIDFEKSEKVLGITGYTEVKEHFSREYDGEVIQINFRGKPITCTPEHPILAVKPYKKYSYNHREYPKYDLHKREWILAEDLEKFDLLLIPKIPDLGRDLNPLFAKWIGFYLAEGSISIHQSSKTVHLDNFNYDKLVPYLKLFGGKIIQEERDEGTLYRLNIYNTRLANWILRIIGKEKRIPEFILKSSVMSKRTFLEGFIEGDGHRRRNETIIFSKSEELTNDLYALLISLHIVPSFWIEEQTHDYKGYQWTSKMHFLSWNKNPKIYEDPKFMYIPIYDIKRLSYKGIVKNIETGDNTYCLPFIVHNCFGRENGARKGEPILQPSPYDGGMLPQDQVGEFYKFVEIKFGNFKCPVRNAFHRIFRTFQSQDAFFNRVDIAFATFKCPYHPVCDPIKNQCAAKVLGIGLPIGKRLPDLNQKVQKVGRTTGKTTGTVVSTSWTGTVKYSRGSATFIDCILISGKNFSQGGDSGSPVLDMNGNYVGALFAGSGDYSIICKYTNIELESGCELVILK